MKLVESGVADKINMCLESGHLPKPLEESCHQISKGDGYPHVAMPEHEEGFHDTYFNVLAEESHDDDMVSEAVDGILLESAMPAELCCWLEC